MAVKEVISTKQLLDTADETITSDKLFDKEPSLLERAGDAVLYVPKRLARGATRIGKGAYDLAEEAVDKAPDIASKVGERMSAAWKAEPLEKDTISTDQLLSKDSVSTEQLFNTEKKHEPLNYGTGYSAMGKAVDKIESGDIPVRRAETRLGKIAERGFSKSIIPSLIKATTGQDPYADVEDVVPEGIMEHVVAGASEFLPDAPLFMLGSSFANMAIKEAPKVIAQQSLKKTLAKWAAKKAAKGAITFGTYEAAKSPVRQVAEKGEFDTGEYLKDIGTGALTGAILDPTISAIGATVGAVGKGAVKTVQRLKHAKRINDLAKDLRVLNDTSFKRATDESQSVLRSTHVHGKITRAKARKLKLENQMKSQINKADDTIRNMGGLSDDYIKSQTAGIKRTKGGMPVLEHARNIDPMITEADLRYAAKEVGNKYKAIAESNGIGQKIKTTDAKEIVKSLDRFYDTGSEYGKAGGNKSFKYVESEIIEKAAEIAKTKGTPVIKIGEPTRVGSELEVANSIQKLNLLEKTKKHRSVISRYKKAMNKQQGIINRAELEAKDLPEVKKAEAALGDTVVPDEVIAAKLAEVSPELEPGSYKIKHREITGKLKAEEYRNVLYKKYISEGLKETGITDAQRQLGVYEPRLEANPFLELTTNLKETFNECQRQTGINAGQIPTDAFRAQNIGKNWYAGKLKEIVKLNKDMEKVGLSGANTDKFTQIAKGQISATPEQKSVVARARKLYTEAWEQAREWGSDVGFLDEYFPKWDKVKLEVGGLSKRAYKKLPADVKMKMEQSRTSAVEGVLVEKDVIKGLENYMRAASKTKLLKEVLPKANNAIIQLRARGHVKEANMIEDWFLQGSGLQKDQARKIFAADFTEKGSLNIQKIMAVQDHLEPSVWEAVMNEMTDQFYHTSVGLSKNLLFFKQPLQNLFVGAPEIGIKWVATGWKTAIKPNAAEKILWQKVKPELAPSKMNFAELSDTVSSAQLKGWAKEVADVSKLGGKPGMFGFTGMDINLNRKGAFFGAYKKLKKLGINDKKIFQTLEPSETEAVFNAYKAGGIEEAAIEFGKTMSDRINYMYSFFDKPFAMQGKLGRRVPFTTWGRNQWSRYVSDIRHGDVKTLAKRLVYPTLFLTLWEAGTGQKAPTGADPVTALAGPFQATASPVVGQVLEPLVEGKFLKAGEKALKTSATYHLLDKVLGGK